MAGQQKTTATETHPMLSIVVPVFNEAGHLEEVIEYMMQSPCPIRREWIFVDDCSSDDSVQILRRMQSKHGFRLVEQPRNRGKGSAVTRGIRESNGDFVMIQDADFEYDPYDVPDLLEPLLGNRADVVFGSRFKKSALQVHRTWHYFVNRLLTILSNAFSGIYLTDMETCYKVFRADLLKAMNLQSTRFGIEVELTAYAAKTTARVYELPIHYYPRTRLQGKKINWKDGIAALFHLVRFNFFVSPAAAFHELPEVYRSPHRPRRPQPNASMPPPAGTS